MHGVRKVELVMRIISQNSQIDLPYNRIMLCVEEELVTAINDGKQYLIGKYSSEAKAIKAMKMCREKYQGFFTKGNCMLGHPKVFRFPADDKI